MAHEFEMKKGILLFSPKDTAVHKMHLEAFEKYASESFRIFKGRNSLGIIIDIYNLRSSANNIFIQSTGILNLIAILFARIFSYKVFYYLHEPTSLKRKISENPFVKAIVWHFVQIIDSSMSNFVLISREGLINKTTKNHYVRKKKIKIAPLLMPEESFSTKKRKFRITYLGRPDDRRFIKDFIEHYDTFRSLKIKQTILTGNPHELNKLLPKIPSGVSVYAEKNFSEDLKSRILSETICLWNPKRGKISQSGVTADAIRFGISILLTEKDPAYKELIDRGIAIDYKKSKNENFTNLTVIDFDKVEHASKLYFSSNHGQISFNVKYSPIFNSI
tara:strand:+ start:7107 stop:8105 length:999 start_codon:yes stop_codon:yes gene_type:complete